MITKKMTLAGVVLAVLLCVTVGVLVGRQTAQPATGKVNPEASARAVAFWKAYFLNQDPGAAWDMSLPETWKQDQFKDRADFVQHYSAPVYKVRPDQPYELTQFARAQDYLYLIKTSEQRYLVWVTQTPKGWMVRECDYYDGGEIPW